MSHAIPLTAIGLFSAGPVTSGRELGLFGGGPNGECVAQQRPSDGGCPPWPDQQVDPAGGWCRLTEPSPLAGRPTPPRRAWASSCIEPHRSPTPRTAARRRPGGWWPRRSWPHTNTDHRHQPPLTKGAARDQRADQTVRNTIRPCTAAAPVNQYLRSRQPLQANF
jgi:hypothetical protein